MSNNAFRESFTVCQTNGATPRPNEKTVTGWELGSFDNLIREYKRSNGAMPQPDDKTVTGRELDSFDNLIRE